MSSRTPALIAVVALSAVVGANAAAAGQSPTQPVTFFDLETTAPVSWTSVEPSSSMRLLQLTVPGADGAEPGEVVVFFFGAGQGGTVQDNIARWQSQFTSADGGAVDVEVSSFEAGGMPVTMAELSGTYRRAVGGAPATPLPDQSLIAAVVETERGSLFIQLHGPSATVAGQREAFDAFVRGLRPADL